MLFRKWISGNKVKTSSLPRKTGSRSPAGPGNAFEKASASASHRGSMTVECAFVLPLFLLGMLTLVSFMEIYKIQTEKLLELCSSARKAGMYAYAVGEPEEITLPAVYSFSRSAVRISRCFFLRRLYTLARNRLYTTDTIGIKNSIPTTPNRLRPTVTAASTQIEGRPTELPTTFG